MNAFAPIVLVKTEAIQRQKVSRVPRNVYAVLCSHYVPCFDVTPVSVIRRAAYYMEEFRIWPE